MTGLFRPDWQGLRFRMQAERPHIFVVDDDRAVLSLVGTNVSCLEVLRALRTVSPHCEAVLTTGYQSVEAAVEALRQSLNRLASETPRSSAEHAPNPHVPAPLLEVERDHIVRTLQLVGGNKAGAARLLGMSRRALYRLLERHGLHRRARSARVEAATRRRWTEHRD
jgi:DNA-binding NtrC family response regulator